MANTNWELQGTVEEQRFLSKVLSENNPSYITSSSIQPEYFRHYSKEYAFISDHIRKYNCVPEFASFKNNFPEFTLVSTAEPITYYEDALAKANSTYKLVLKYTNIAKLLQDGKTDEALLADAKAVPATGATYLSNVPNILDPTVALKREQLYEDKVDNFDKYYCPTGFDELDRLLGGGWDSREEFVTYVARPGVGKSWCVILAAVAAARAGKRVGYYSGEMSVDKVAYRADTYISHISNAAMAHGGANIRDEYQSYIANIADKTKKGGAIYVATVADDFDGRTPTTRDFEAFMERYNLDTLCIDQQSLMDDMDHAKNPIDKAGNIARDIKLLATRTGKHIVTCCQQNRESIEDGYSLSNIAGSDKVGQYSTVVIFVEYNKETKILKLIVAKVRDGGFGTLCYTWDIDKGIFQFQPDFAGDEESVEASQALMDEYGDSKEGNIF